LPAFAADLFPLAAVQPGMRGVGRTVFSGDKIEEFQVEILGVIENTGPKESIILARLSGGPLENTGVIAGMSGSPVYLEGKLAGAVAYTFAFSKESIAGIRPIHEMLADVPDRPANQAGTSATPVGRFPRQGSASKRELASNHPLQDRVRLLPSFAEPVSLEPRLEPIATPVGLAGFSDRIMEFFGPQLRSIGLQPMQGVAGRGRASSPEGAEPAALEPGSMISIGLIEGDMDVSASGTVTYVDGKRIHAFGHRFMSSGPTEYPIRRSSVITVVPNLSNSFKIATTGELLGKITLDRSTGISGWLGEGPRMAPLHLSVHSGNGVTHDYNVRIVEDPFLAPFLTQMAVFSAVDATERQVGASSLRLRGEVQFGDGTPALRLDNMFAGPSNVGLQAALGAAIPLAYVLQSGFDPIPLGNIRLQIEASDEEKTIEIDRVWSNKLRVRPGETIELSAVLSGPNGAQSVRTVDYRVPVGLQPGDLQITFSDGDAINALEWQGIAADRRPRSLGELVRAVNRLRPNDRLYVRVWRPGRAVRLQTESLPSPPASVLSVVAAPTAAGSGSSNDWQSTLEEFEVDGLESVLRGNASIKVTVIE
jgi:hypothetical protein